MANNKKNQAEDIFGEVDSPKKTGGAARSAKMYGTQRPGPQNSQPPLKQRTAQASAFKSTPSATPLKKAKKSLRILILFIVVIIIGLLGVLVYSVFFNNDNSASVQNNNLNNSSAVNTGNTAVVLELPPIVQGAVDEDGDGLTDEEERELGTNPRSIDTDRDGLFDREEVKVYLTDPTKRDTDGDGNPDGTEVVNGFNPNGSGVLLDMESEIKELRTKN